MAISSFTIQGNTLYIKFGSETEHPMLSRSFPIITDTKGVKYAQIENYELNEWLDIDATDRSEMSKDEDDLIELSTLCDVAASRNLPMTSLSDHPLTQS